MLNTSIQFPFSRPPSNSPSMLIRVGYAVGGVGTVVPQPVIGWHYVLRGHRREDTDVVADGIVKKDRSKVLNSLYSRIVQN
jgi:hypothetical protein